MEELTFKIHILEKVQVDIKLLRYVYFLHVFVQQALFLQIF